MSIPFSIYHAPKQINTVNIAETITGNLIVSEGTNINDRAFITTTAVGYVPVDFLGSNGSFILPFMKRQRDHSTSELGYLRLPKGSIITRCTLSNNDVELVSESELSSIRVYTSLILGEPPLDNTNFISLYDNVNPIVINNSTVLIVRQENSDVLGSTGVPPSHTLTDESYILVQSSNAFTSGELRISIEYQIPVVKN